MDPMSLDLDCGVCGQSAVVTDLDPVRLEHALETFARLHGHTQDERNAWYRAELSTIDTEDDE